MKSQPMNKIHRFFIYFCAMLGFIKKTVAKIWAKNHVTQTEDFKNNAEVLQEKLLLDLIKKSEKTLFGLQHNFSEIKSVKDFQKNVKICDYEDLKPFIEKVKHGDKNILWPE